MHMNVMPKVTPTHVTGRVLVVVAIFCKPVRIRILVRLESTVVLCRRPALPAFCIIASIARLEFQKSKLQIQNS